MPRRNKKNHQAEEDLLKRRSNSLSGPHMIPEKFAQLVQQLDEGFLLCDESGIITFASDKTYLLCGTKELNGQPLESIFELLPPNWKMEVNTGLFQNAIFKPFGNPEKELLLRIQNAPDESYLVILQDGSFIEEAITALKEGQDRYNAIFNHTVDGIIIIDQNGYIDMVNPAAAKLFGYNPEELYGKNVSVLMPQPYRHNHDAYINNYVKGGKPKIIGIGREVVGIRKDGNVFPFHLSISEVNLQHRRLFTGIIHDISYQKQAEEKLRSYAHELEERVQTRTIELAETIKKLQESNLNLKRAQEEIRKAYEKEKELSELKSRFVTTASHEFRTPLSTILSSASLISKYESTEDQDKRQKHIQRIKSSVNNLTTILEDFLSLSKLEEGKIQVHPQEFELNPYLEELSEEMQTLLKEGQQLQFTGGRELKLVQDKQLLRNVLINLISNAIKYSPENGLISVGWHQQEQYLRLSVADQGMGIPAEEQEYLFTRFFRASNATNIQGTGLGLHIVKKYIDLMGADIQFKSSAEGTIFTIQLPLVHPNT